MSAFGVFLAVLSAGLILLAIVGYAESFHTVTVPVYRLPNPCRQIDNLTYCRAGGPPPQPIKTNMTQTCTEDVFGFQWSCKENP